MTSNQQSQFLSIFAQLFAQKISYIISIAGGLQSPPSSYAYVSWKQMIIMNFVSLKLHFPAKKGKQAFISMHVLMAMS